MSNKHKAGIKALRLPGESYSAARRRYLEARDLPPDTTTSDATARRKLAAVAAEYGDALGIDIMAPEAAAAVVVEARRGGRAVERADAPVIVIRRRP